MGSVLGRAALVAAVALMLLTVSPAGAQNVQPPGSAGPAPSSQDNSGGGRTSGDAAQTGPKQKSTSKAPLVIVLAIGAIAVVATVTLGQRRRHSAENQARQARA